MYAQTLSNELVFQSLLAGWLEKLVEFKDKCTYGWILHHHGIEFAKMKSLQLRRLSPVGF